jgi:RNA polymerase sigma-70 factor (ECF subfamily)
VSNKNDLNNIIEGCLREKRKYQEQLFKLYYGKMMGVALRYTKDRDTAQEIVQNSFIKVFEKLSTFDQKGNFSSWISRIVANTAIDFIRKSKNNPFLTDENYVFDNANDEISEFDDLELSSIKTEIILKAIQQLSPAYQTVFNLYVIEDYSHKEIAEMLGISEGTSKSNLSKAKMNIHKIIAEELKVLF